MILMMIQGIILVLSQQECFVLEWHERDVVEEKIAAYNCQSCDWDTQWVYLLFQQTDRAYRMLSKFKYLCTHDTTHPAHPYQPLSNKNRTCNSIRG